MNVDQAIKHLKKIGWTVFKISENEYDAHRIGEKDNPIISSFNSNYTARKLIKLASAYSSENNQNTKIKKNVKHFSNGKNRTKQRNVMTSSDDEIIDEEFGTHNHIKEDIWTWD